MKIDEAAKAAMRELREAGHSYKDIASQVGCSVATVFHVINPENLQRKLAHNRLMDQARLRNYREKIHEIKLEAGCADCGYKEHAAALDFDHLPGTEKLFDVSQGSRLRWRDVFLEIAKCDVVCANCHRVRTWNRTRGQTESSV